MQTNNVIKSAALVIALFLPFLSYPAEARTDTPDCNFVGPEMDAGNGWTRRVVCSPRFNNGETGTAIYGADTRSDTGSFVDAPGVQYPDVRE